MRNICVITFQVQIHVYRDYIAQSVCRMHIKTKTKQRS